MNQSDIRQSLNAALNQLQTGNMAGARKHLAALMDQVEVEDPAYPEIISMFGLTWLEEDPDRAVDLMRQAVKADAEEPQFRVHLASGLIQKNDLQAAEKELHLASELSNGAEQAVAPWANCLIRMGEFAKAEQVLTQALSINPASDPLRRLMSQLRFQAGDTFAAFDLFTGALGPEGPRNPGDALTLARLANTIQDFKTADFATGLARKMIGGHPEVAVTAAQIAEIHGRRGDVIAIAREGLQNAPDHPGLMAFVIAHDPSVSEREISQAEMLTRRSDDSAGARELQFALARLYDRQGEYGLAWKTLSDANQTFLPPQGPLFIHRTDNYTYEKLIANLDIARKLAKSVEASHSPLEQIILAGPPRTGGSLVQTILAAAPDVISVGERAALLPSLLTLVENRADKFPDNLLEELRGADINGLARMGITDGKIVDKTPHNLHVLGLIGKVHPSTTFMDIVRDPRDVFVSILLHNLSGAYAYAHQPELIVSYLQFRADAMKAWGEDGLDIHRVTYEEIARNPASGGATLYAAAGLDWDEGYLRPENRSMPVKTFSAMQVHDEINDHHIGRWRNYAEFMEPVLGRLTRLAEDEYGL